MQSIMKPFGLFLLSCFFIISCSNAPDQSPYFADLPPDTDPTFKENKDASNNVEAVSGDILGSSSDDGSNGVDNTEDGGWLGEEGSADVDQIVKENSEKPIIYGVGASGVTLETTFEESKKILTKPLFGPNQDGEANYNEKVFIRWRTEGERKTPHFILALPGYKGKLQITKPSGGIKGDISLSQEFSSYMGSNPRADADQLAIDMYRALTGSEENCVQDNICEVNWGDEFQNYYLVVFPGMIVRLSKDRFILFISLVQKTIPQGPLASDFDLFQSSFIVKNKASIQLGDSFESVEKRMVAADKDLANVEISVGTDNFGRNYSGVYTIYEKTDFSRESKKPQATDRLFGVQLYDQYRNQFLVDGLPIYIVETSDSVEVKDLPKSNDADAQIKTLQTKMNIDSKLILPFTEKLVSYLKTQAQRYYPVVSGRVLGKHQIKDIKEYVGQIVAYNPETKKGIYISFTTSEETGNLQSLVTIIIRKDLAAYDALVVPMSADDQAVEKKPVTVKEAGPGREHYQVSAAKHPHYTELSGVRLNDLLKVSDTDIFARGEATVEFVRPLTLNTMVSPLVWENVGAKERTSYNDQGELFLPAVNNNLLPRSQHFTSVSNFGVGLGVVPVGQVGNDSYVRVVSISSGFVNGQLNDLCGLKGFKPKFGIKDTVFEKKLRRALKKENKSCNYFLTYDDGSNNRLSAVYFPDDRIRLSFGDRELAGAMIYLPTTEVLPMAAQGGQQ